MNKKYQAVIKVGVGNKAELEAIFQMQEQIEDGGSLFVLWENRYSNGVLKNPFLEGIEKALERNLDYVNTIILPKAAESDSRNLKNNVQYLLWFAKDISLLKFNKDAIREKHIWKDVEWGGRAKNYNPKGKDPGNVWIPTLDNGNGQITDHLILQLEEWLNRCLKSTTRENDRVLINLPKGTKIDRNKLVRKYVHVSYFDKGTPEKPRKTINHIVTKDRHDPVRGAVIFDSSEKMSALRSNSVDLMVTSPPYWDLKSYFKQGEIGQESYSQYLKRMNSVWRETYRVLKKDGNIFININLRVKSQQPILIPLNIIKQCQKLGLNLVDVIVWHKSSGIPTHSKNIVSRHEYVLWFAKSSAYKFNKEAISQIVDYKKEELNHGLLWNLNRKAGSVGSNFIHPAIFPLSLTDRIIELTTSRGDLVLDPFLGSGTTLISALKLGRSSIGYEYNESFESLIKHRLKEEKVNLKSVDFTYPYQRKETAPIASLEVFRGGLAGSQLEL